MKSERFNEFFPRNDERAVVPLEALLQEVRNSAFYAPVLVSAFLEEADPQTIVTLGVRTRINMPEYAVGAKLPQFDDGYIILKGDFRQHLTLCITSWKDWREITIEEFRQSLLNTRINVGHEPLVYISADEERSAGMTIPIKGQEKLLVQSDLRIQFKTTRFKVAPHDDPDNSLVWWVMGNFVPRFLNDQVKPFANVPVEEMVRWLS